MTEKYVPQTHCCTNVVDRLVVVLVETSDPGNIGGSARALKTMGLEHLRLVSPLHFPHPKAMWRAKNAVEIVEQAQVYESLMDAVADCQLVMAASARSRSLPWPCIDPCEAATLAVQSSQQRVALVFGREKSGLTNDELQQCHRHIVIPANPKYPVLNLSHAVQVICYEVFSQLYKQEEIDTHFGVQWDQPLAEQKSVQSMFAELQKTLAETGFYNPNNPDKLIPRLQRMLLRTGLDQMEVNILRGVLRHINTLHNRQGHHGHD